MLQFRLVQAVLKRFGQVLGQATVSSFRDMSMSITSIFSVVDALTVVLFPLSMSFTFPLFVQGNIEERSRGLDKYMRLFGVKTWEMEVVRTFWQLVSYCILFAGTLVFAFAFRFKFFTAGRPEQYVVLLLLWAPAQLGMASLLSKFISRPRRALFVGFVSMFIAMIVGSLLNVLVYDTSLPPWYSLLLPPLAFCRGFTTIILNYQSAEFATQPGDFWICAAFLGGVSLVLLVVGSDTFGDVLSHLNPFRRIWALLLRRSVEVNDSTSHRLLDDRPGHAADEEALSETQRVLSGALPNNTVLVVRDLTKVFQSLSRTTVAVNHLSLSVRDGECFGLLGENGAGKSTTISMICGQLDPTGGTVIVGGSDVSSDTTRVQANIGVCMQQDLFFPRLTVREHLLFFARLRGVPILSESKIVDGMIEEVGLEEARRRYATKLSGGMQRRLSIAIAMCGDPLLCILDEPTSGLDAASRRAVWDIISKARRTRSIVVSSHHLDEIEALCNRVCIISAGKMACIGTLAELKLRYGRGYKLVVSATSDNQARAHAFVTTVLPRAVRESSFAGLSIYRLQQEDVRLSALFAQMNKDSRLHGIRDWSVQVASLEEIFLKMSNEKDE